MLPTALRESLITQLDSFLEALGGSPEPEALASFIVEQLEEFAEEWGIDDIISNLEDHGALDGPFADVFENALMSSESTETSEEVIDALEQLCEIEWDDEMRPDNEDESEGEEEEEEEF